MSENKRYSVKLSFTSPEVSGTATVKVEALNINEAFYVARRVLLKKWPDITVTGGESKYLARKKVSDNVC